LKKKKDRRKKRHAADKTSHPTPKPPATNVPNDDDSNLAEEQTPETLEPKREKKKKKKKEKKDTEDAAMQVDDRPRKKRKGHKSTGPEENNLPAVQTSPEPQAKHQESLALDELPPYSESSRSSSRAASPQPSYGYNSHPQPSTLPSFPLPSQPDAPSAAELGRQGLDAALLAATQVDAQTTMSLDDESLKGVINDRLKGRLSGLGVTELFAGSYSQTLFVP
jgi:ATP-dependent RNA helicase DDX51/DBP6